MFVHVISTGSCNRMESYVLCSVEGETSLSLYLKSTYYFIGTTAVKSADWTLHTELSVSGVEKAEKALFLGNFVCDFFLLCAFVATF